MDARVLGHDLHRCRRRRSVSAPRVGNPWHLLLNVLGVPVDRCGSRRASFGSSALRAFLGWNKSRTRDRSSVPAFFSQRSSAVGRSTSSSVSDRENAGPRPARARGAERLGLGSASMHGAASAVRDVTPPTADLPSDDRTARPSAAQTIASGTIDAGSLPLSYPLAGDRRAIARVRMRANGTDDVGRAS